MFLLFAALGCTVPVAKGTAPTHTGEPDPTDTAGEGDTGASTGETGETGETSDTDQLTPCTPVGGVFFDLGETLVTENRDRMFEEIPGATELLLALRAQGLPIGMISNTGRGWDLDDVRDLLVDPSILDLFDVILLSSQAESDAKPDPAIFVEGVGLLDPPPPMETTVFVTEDLEDLSDGDPPTEGAKAAGMIGVHVTDGAQSPLVDYALAPDDLPAMASWPWLVCLETR